MDFHTDTNLGHDDEDAADLARLERLFARRAQKAQSYCRVLLTTPSRPMAFAHPAG